MIQIKDRLFGFGGFDEPVSMLPWGSAVSLWIRKRLYYAWFRGMRRPRKSKIHGIRIRDVYTDMVISLSWFEVGKS